jgi:hypothetical protein
MARVFNNRIPENWLTKEKLNLNSKLNFDSLLNSGCIWFEDENGLRLEHSRTRDARSGLSGSDSSLNSPKGECEGKTPLPFDRDAEFAALWAAYPKPLGKKAAQRHFTESVKTVEDLAAIKRALENYRASAAALELRYVKHGSTWFNNWRDYIDFKEPNGHANAGTDRRGVAAKDSGSTVEIQPVTGQQGRRLRPCALSSAGRASSVRSKNRWKSHNENSRSSVACGGHHSARTATTR